MLTSLTLNYINVATWGPGQLDSCWTLQGVKQRTTSSTTAIKLICVYKDGAHGHKTQRDMFDGKNVIRSTIIVICSY